MIVFQAVIDVLTLIILAATAYILLKQAAIANRNILADHERRKKQSTLEFVQRVRPAWLAAKQEIDDKWGKNPLTSRDLEELRSDKNLVRAVRNLLGTLEHLSVGMNSGVFDRDLLYRMSGSQLIGIHDRLSGYIDKVVRTSGRSSLYCEYRALVQDFKARRAVAPPNEGDILHS